MKFHVDIDLPVPRWARRAALVLVPVGVVLATTAIVRAGVPNVFATGDTLSAQTMNQNFSSLDTRVTTLEGAQAVPSGTIIAFGGATAPAGWLPCDGTPLDGTSPTYAALYTAIGIAYGGNTTSMQFNLPDLRGRFIRGWDHGAGHDPEAAGRVATATGGNTGDTVGSQQGDEIQSHAHGITDPGHTHPSYAENPGQNLPSGAYFYAGTQNAPGFTAPTGAATTGISVQSTGGAETRPLNIAVNYIIKL